MIKNLLRGSPTETLAGAAVKKISSFFVSEYMVKQKNDILPLE
jgi:hypothetical protein